ncbi:MAG: hypothetical protein IPJ34_20835 [Myxococcales bacterium]|nr:hypothetical protein [Myxococcales bacterium]
MRRATSTEGSNASRSVSRVARWLRRARHCVSSSWGTTIARGLRGATSKLSTTPRSACASMSRSSSSAWSNPSSVASSANRALPSSLFAKSTSAIAARAATCGSTCGGAMSLTERESKRACSDCTRSWWADRGAMASFPV